MRASFGRSGDPLSGAERSVGGKKADFGSAFRMPQQNAELTF